MKFVYLFGAPGSGKTTLMTHLRFALEAYPQERILPSGLAFMAWMRDGKVVAAELGAKRGAFSGTDALPMDAIERAIPFVEKRPYPLMFAEGDRLANGRFFDAVMAAGYELRPFYLDTPEEIAANRRTVRAVQLGKAPQDPKWVAGRVTKARNLAEHSKATVLDGTFSGDSLAEQVLAEIGDAYQEAA